MKTINKIIEKAGFKLAQLKEAFIIEELEPYLEEGELKQKLKLRLQEKEDWKNHVLKLIDEEEKELQEINKKIPERFKKLIDNETNQHMRIQASLSFAEELKQKINGV